MKYDERHIAKLNSEVRNRFDNLLYALIGPVSVSGFININGVDIRLAVDDFKAILVEIRKLK